MTETRRVLCFKPSGFRGKEWESLELWAGKAACCEQTFMGCSHGSLKEENTQKNADNPGRSAHKVSEEQGRTLWGN